MSDTPFDALADPAATVTRHPHLRHAPASARNREPIRHALAQLLPATPCTVLEIASGTGEHALWMARALPHVIWQPS
jgi:predicted O-methyltransferase YrrM